MSELDKHIDYWKTTSLRDLKTASSLYTSKNYYACLLFCHIALEKMLKGLVLKAKNKQPPMIHDLLRLTKLAKLSISDEMKSGLGTINDFNILARYEDYKQSFYRKATRSYTKSYLLKTEEYIKWLKKYYQNK